MYVSQTDDMIDGIGFTPDSNCPRPPSSSPTPSFTVGAGFSSVDDLDGTRPCCFRHTGEMRRVWRGDGGKILVGI